MRPVNLLSPNINLIAGETKFFDIIKIHHIEFAIAIKDAMVIITIVADVTVVTILAILIVPAIVTLIVFS